MSSTRDILKAVKSMRDVHARKVTRMEIDAKGLGTSLRNLRFDLDISLREMARRIGISAAFLSECETGQKCMPLAQHIKFVKECMKP